MKINWTCLCNVLPSQTLMNSIRLVFLQPLGLYYSQFISFRRNLVPETTLESVWVLLLQLAQVLRLPDREAEYLRPSQDTAESPNFRPPTKNRSRVGSTALRISHILS